MSAGPRATHYLPGRSPVSSWGLWRRKHRERGARCGKGQAGATACPCVPPLGCKQRLLGHTRGACPGILSAWLAGGEATRRSQPGTGLAALGPALALLQGAERGPRQCGGGALGTTPWAAPGTAGDSGNGGRWEREQRTRGRMERRDAPWHRDTNARTRGGRRPAGPRHGRASGGGRRGRGRGGRGRGGSLPRTRLCTRSAERGARSSRC